MKVLEKNLHCQVCGESAARYEGGKLIIYSHSATHNVEIAFEDVLEAVGRGRGKGIILLRDYYDANNCIFG